MRQRLALTTLLVADYDEARAFFTQALGFDLVDDQQTEPGRRWLVVRPAGCDAGGLLLARAETDEEWAAIGRQAACRVLFILETDDFHRDHAAYTARGVRFLEPPRHEPYGWVAVFEDLSGNRWDLIERPA